MHKFKKQHKDFTIGDICTYTGDYLQALIDAGIIEEVKKGLKGMPSMKRTINEFIVYADYDGELQCDGLDDNGQTDRYLFEFGNYFPTKQAAEEHNNWLIARTELIRACHEISGRQNGFNHGQTNYYIYYNSTLEEFKIDSELYTVASESFLHLRTSAQAQRLINEHSDALKVYLGVE